MAGRTLAGVLGYVRRLARTNDAEGQSDGELLRRFTAGRDERAFAALLQRHGPLVLGVCREVLRGDLHGAEDAFQATFLVLARKAAAVRRQEAVGAWLYRVACNLAADARRSAARRRARERQAVTMSETQAVDEHERHDWQPILHEEVNRLPARYRTPVVLCYLQGKTHEEAARELRCPVGTVKGRLARARDLLRARLVRRGLALSAAGLAAALSGHAALAAVSTALLESTLKAAVLFAAGKTALAGLASLRAVTLAKGALKTMAATKLSLVTLLVLVAGVVGTGGTFAFRPHAENREKQDGWEGRLPSNKATSPVVSHNQADEAGPAAEVLQVTLASVQKECLPGKPVDLTLTIKNNGKEEFSYPHYKLQDLYQLTITGPDGNEVKPRPNPAEIEFASTVVTVRPGEAVTVKEGLQGINLPKAGTNRYLRHAFYPMETPGTYRLRIRVGDADSNDLEVKVVGTEESGPVDEKGLRFVALVPRRVPAPGAGGSRDFDLALRVTNLSDKPVAISVNDVIRPRLTSVDGESTGLNLGRNGTPKPQPPVTLAPAASWTWRPEAKLAWTGGDRSTLRLGGPDGRGVPGVWWFATMKQRKYRLSVEYANQNPKLDDVPLWVGTATTKEVEFEIAAPEGLRTFERVGPAGAKNAGAAESKPVRVNDVDFQAVIDAKCPTPAAGDKQFVDLGLRLTNRGDKTLLFNLYDTLRLGLKSADGKAFEYEWVRLRTAVPEPVRLKKGETTTVYLDAYLKWRADRPGRLQLGGTDPTGGFWNFDGIAPGKYLLHAEYENTDKTLANFQRARRPAFEPGEGEAFWLGKVTTDAAAFEVTPPARPGKDPAAASVGALVGDLDSAEGAKRVAATRELLRRGKAVLKDLEAAGAREVVPVVAPTEKQPATRRLDLVYSLIRGLPRVDPKSGMGIRQDRITLRLEKGVTRAEFDRMARLYKFGLHFEHRDMFRPDAATVCDVVTTQPALESVLTEILTTAPKVETISLIVPLESPG